MAISEQRPTISAKEAMRQVKYFVDEHEKLINEANGTPGKKDRAGRKKLAQGGKLIVEGAFRVIAPKHLTVKRPKF